MSTRSKLFRPNRGGLGTRPVFNGRKNIKDMYDSEWARYSRKFLSINNKCYCCNSKSEVTDHVIPHKGSEVLFKKLDNHIPLCKICHNTVTALFDKQYIAGSSIERKLIWINQMRSNNSVTIAVKVLPQYGR